MQNKSCSVGPTIFPICRTKITFILHLFNPVFSKTFVKKLIIYHASPKVVFNHLWDNQGCRTKNH